MKLYKYRNWTNLTQLSLGENYIWLSSPEEFNDPFDCHIYDHYSLFDKTYIEKEKTGMLTEANENYYEKVIYASYKECGIACFCESPFEILMWSHYANNHKGICIEYDFDMLPNSLELIQPVRYTRMYPKLNLKNVFSGHINYWDYLKTSLTTKYTDWKYEKEWRLIIAGYSNKRLFHIPQLVKSIFLGCKVSVDDCEKIKCFYSTKEYKPQLFICIQSKEKFELEYKCLNY